MASSETHMSKTYWPVAGTGDWNQPDDDLFRWWRERSFFTDVMADHGWHRRGPSWHGVELPAWSTQLTGTFFAGRNHRTWKRETYEFARALELVPPEDRNLVCHSWGGIIGVKVANLLEPYGGIARLVTVNAPMRKSMRPEYEKAAASCEWLQLYNTNIWTNRMQWLGARGGPWFFRGATAVRVRGGGHSDLLRKPQRFLSTISEVIVPFLEA